MIVGNDLHVSSAVCIFFEYFLYVPVVKKIIPNHVLSVFPYQKTASGWGFLCSASLPCNQPVPHPQASSPVKHPDREAGLSLKGDWLHKVVSDLYSCHGMRALQIIIIVF